MAVVAVVVLGSVAALALTGVAILRAGTQLQAARQELVSARRALTDGDLSAAQEGFGAARDRFVDASEAADGGPTWLPLLGNNLRATSAIASSGAHLSTAGVGMTGAILGLPEGLDSLAPEGGRLPLGVYASLQEAAATARAEGDAAEGAIVGAPETWLVPPVRDARWDAEALTVEAAQVLRSADALLGAVPVFAGADGPRRYLVLAENPAELRSTGGLWGAYSILTLEGGRPTFGSTAPSYSLPTVTPDELPAPNPEYAEHYNRFGGAASWHNLNMTPDFPSAARAAIANYEAATGRPVDGVIVADPFALEEMLRVTGPMQVQGAGIRIDADNVVDFTTNRAYTTFEGDPLYRKEALGGTATQVLQRFLEMPRNGIGKIKAITRAAAAGHLKFYSAHDAVQRRLEEAGISTGVPTEGDVVGVFVNNGSGSKIDYYAERSVAYDVVLGEGGRSEATLTTTIANEAPKKGLPRYVLGPFIDGADAGEQWPYVTVACVRCEAIDARRDGEPVPVVSGSELGLHWYRDQMRIAAGGTASLAVDWRAEGAWEGDDDGGRYRLTVLGQNTIRPTELQITIQTPTGTDVVWTSEPMAVEAGTATWEGTAGARTILEVRFR
jgi:hypothetical protein